MRKKSVSESGWSRVRSLGALVLGSAAMWLAMFSFAASEPRNTTTTAAATATAPTFGHPVIVGIGGNGFEEDLRVDPSNPLRVYTSVPASLSSDTSFIWRSLDAGKTFKWVPSSAPLTGKAVACAGGGDTELGVDINGHVYFADLTLANFSTARSDNQGATFLCSNSGVPDAVVDRQWYAFDGDPTNGGSIYLTNDEVAQAPAQCGSSATNIGQNVLVMYRSPVAGTGPTAGIQFGPSAKVSNPLGCDEGIMGNNEVSPVATALGQPDGNGGFAKLSMPVKHIFVIHDDSLFSKIKIGRCFPVAFGPPVANVSDPSGLNCTDIQIADLGTSKTGGNFPTMAIDKAGNLYIVWEQAPADASGNITGDTVLMFAYSTDEGNTWSKPTTIDTSGSPAGVLHNNVLPWIAAGDDGRVGIAWYGTPGAPNYTDATQNHGPDSCPKTCDWSLWYVTSTNAHSASPTFSAPVQASEHFVHRGSEFTTGIGGQNGDRSQGDFLQLRVGAQGEAEISYSDSNNIDESTTPHAMFVRQSGGESLFAANTPLQISGLTPFNSVSDPAGDGRYESNGTVSDNIPQLDIVGSSIREFTNAPCSADKPCYEVTMQVSDLTNIAPNTQQDPDTDLVWLTQWLVPSTSDPNGGKNFFAYAESNNGAALQCFDGENATMAVGGGVTMTYPGAIQLAAANCISDAKSGTIKIYVPLADVAEKDPIDNKLHEVTASTMTLQAPANTVPSVGGIGGSLFNTIDVAPPYVFDPSQATAAPPVQLVNISGRNFVQGGDKIGDGGFIIRGTGTKRVLIRGLGPSLPVSDPLQDPILELHDSTGAILATNDNWKSTQQPDIQATGLAPSDDHESAIVASLAAGNYTAVLRGTSDSTGVGQVEIYDLDPPNGGEFANLSVRAEVDTGDNVLIDGVILQGSTPKRILFRALGPSLKTNSTPVAGRMDDPTMELHDVNGTLIASNDNWKDASNASDVQATLPPPDDHESAILVSIGPGNYTSIVRGVNNTTGIALNEIYKVDQ